MRVNPIVSTCRHPVTQADQFTLDPAMTQTCDLTTQHRDLVTKDKNLDLLRPLATQTQHDQLQHLTQGPGVRTTRPCRAPCLLTSGQQRTESQLNPRNPVFERYSRMASRQVY
jgi:hypothetical protein